MTPNFGALLEATSRRQPDRPSLVWETGQLTWRELDLRAGGVARRLARRGVRPGDTIALALPNGCSFVAALWGGLKLGATVAPLDPLLSAAERDKVLGHLGPTCVVDDVTADEAVWSSAAGTDAPALILYTSGSTGEPKGVVLSHAALGAANDSWAGPVMRLTPEDRVLAVLPLAHSLGLNGSLLAPLLAGATVAVMERFSPEGVLEAVRRHRITVFPGVATMFRRVLDAPGCSRAAFAGLRLAVSGAAPCPWRLAEEWRERSGVRILRGYGMTELFRPISYLADDPTDRPDAVGRPVPGVEICIVGESGRCLPPGEAGELWIRSPAAMEGYLRAPEETLAVLEDGWFKSGDLAWVSPDGFVSIAGRKRELILRGGYSVVPGDVEAVLLGHPAVAEAAVVGLQDPDLGEEVAAFVILHPGAAVRPAELVAHCREHLAAFKYPRHVSIVGELPRSATGKILKSQLGQMPPES